MRTVLLATAIVAGAAPSHGQSPGAAAPQSAHTEATATKSPPSPAAIPTVGPGREERRKPPTPAMRRVAAANRQALIEPQAKGFVNAVQVYPFSPGALYRLYAAPERVSDIALQPGETVVSVAAGDTARWTVGDTTSGSGEAKRVHILVKPFAAGLSTNLIITTTRRAYHVHLESTPATAMTALSWTYPQDEMIAIRRAEAIERSAAPVASGLAVERLDFSYSISGDAPRWRPLRAFNDGRQTYIEFPADIAVGEAPPLFLVDDEGEAMLVNYRMAGRFYVVDRLFEIAELRLGERKQAIVRITRGSVERRKRRGRAS